MSQSTHVAFAYAAFRAASDDRDAAITALDTVLAGQYTLNTTGAGIVMTSVSEANKSFSYTLPQGFGPKEITDTTFAAIQFLQQHTQEELDAGVCFGFRRRRNVAQLGFR